MIDPDVQLPRARLRLLGLCNLLSYSADADASAALTKQIEQTALDIGYVFAVDLLQQGWKPNPSIAAELEARLSDASPIAA